MPSISSRGSLSASGFGFANTPTGPLFSFSSFTFTTNLLGRAGPSLATLLSMYSTSSYPWLNNSIFFNVPNFSGIQRFTIPKTGSYRIKTIAPGSYNTSGYSRYYRGAELQADFTLNRYDYLWILCGQMGFNGTTNGNGCGSGGTFVVKGAIDGSFSQFTPLLISGGGGGVGNETNNSVSANTDASLTTAGNNGNKGYGGSAGSGGVCNSMGGMYGGGGGGGLNGNGSGTSNYSSPGGAFVNGGVGGLVSGNQGGFGGGGAGIINDEPAGGGGYSGGGGGGYEDVSKYISPALPRRGGGGGSYISGTNQSSALSSNLVTYGSVIITAL